MPQRRDANLRRGAPKAHSCACLYIPGSPTAPSCPGGPTAPGGPVGPDGLVCPLFLVVK